MNKHTARTMTDTVAVVINALGFTPTSSVALMLMRDSNLLATLRVDASPGAPAEQWAEQITNHVHRVTDANGVILTSFEDDEAMSTAQYRALGDTLAHAGCPIRAAILITGGHVMDYDGDSTDSVEFSKVATSDLALAHMLATTKIDKLAIDVPPCTSPTAPELLAQFIDEAQEMDWLDAETRALVRGTLADLVTGYRHSSKVSPEHAAWLVGTCTNKSVRDLLISSLATSTDDLDVLKAVLFGEIVPENWDFLNDGADAFFAALEYIEEEHRADLLTGIGWVRWLSGRGTEAMKFLALAQRANPEHRLSHLLSRLIESGHLPTSATTQR